jgi:hypothetical protein
VLRRSHLAATPDGRTFVVALMLSNPGAPVNNSATAAAVLAVTAGAFELLRGQTR